MSKPYNPREIEKKWQQYWEKEGLHKAEDFSDKPKAYVLDMFPYPSGSGLHVGHPLGYIATDVLSRYLRMNGKNVLHPMGWDAFGLPAENYAIKNKVHPRVAVEENIKRFKEQLALFGFSYDWSREINTTDPKYYKWTQWIFLQLFKAGLAYEDDIAINFCLDCKTGLANEEVKDGRCERCGHAVEKRKMRQWVLKITEYADRLLEDLDDLNWMDQLKEMQRNWIGRSSGAEVTFKIRNTNSLAGTDPAKHVQSVAEQPQNNAEVTEQTTKQRYVLLHCYKGDSESCFKPWLKEELEALGHEVVIPDMPGSGEPNIEEQVQFLLDDVEFDERTVVVTHSLGGVAAMKLLPRLKQPIAELVMVAPPIRSGADQFLDGVSRPVLDDCCDWTFDFDAVRAKANRIVVLGDTKDHILPIEQPREVANALSAEYREPESRETHFMGKKEPAVLEALLRSSASGLPASPRRRVEAGRDSALTEVRVYTTRPDTLFGATYVVLAPEHDLVQELLNNEERITNTEEVAKYVAAAIGKSDLERQENKEKTGVRIEGISAVNPVNGEELPVFVADYILMQYGTGAIMAVPAHDERDFEFAKKFDLPITQVVSSDGKTGGEVTSAMSGDGILVNSGDFSGMSADEARKKITEWLTEQGSGAPKVNYKLRDWIFSRQRYWGEPIPIIHCPWCKQQAESATTLTFYDNADRSWQRLLSGEKTVESRALNPKEKSRQFADIREGDTVKCVNKTTDETAYFRITATKIFSGFEDLFADKEWLSAIYGGLELPESLEVLRHSYAYTNDYVERIEKNGLVAWRVERVIPGVVAVPEEELPLLLPEVESYEPTGTGESPLAAIDEWVNVKCPRCGGSAKRETNTMPQWAGSCWYYLRYIDPDNAEALVDPKKEKYWMPIDLYLGGAEHAVLHLLYARFWHKVLFDGGHVSTSEPFQKLFNQGMILGEDHQKMSKSRGNVISPDEVIEQYGADSFRLYEMFMGPLEQEKPWDTQGIIGTFRFLRKVYSIMQDVEEGIDDEDPIRLPQRAMQAKLIAKVSKDIDKFDMNTAIAAMMEYLNERLVRGPLSRKEAEIFVLLLAPFAPHIAEEIWQEVLENQGSVHRATWPKRDVEGEKLAGAIVVIRVQVNGKMRGIVNVQKGSSKAKVVEVARALGNVKRAIGDSDIKKTIFVQDTVVNFIIT